MMDETEEETLVINEEYARIYEQRKRKQELLKRLLTMSNKSTL